MTTPNMLLDLPVVSTTLGPQWAEDVNTSFEVVDAHDHTSGKGVQVPTAGIDIDADLGFGGYNATALRTTRYDEQSGELALSTDLGCIYNVGGDLYWNNGDGTAVQITDGAALSATSLGGISGLPSGTAGVAFAGSRYTFNSATNRRATMDVGPIYVRDTAVGPGNGVRLTCPVSLAAGYDLTLPATLPAGTSFVTITSDGTLAAGPLVAAGITRSMQAAVGQQVSSAVDFTTSSASFTDITGLTVTITTSGRPIIIMAVPDAGLAAGAVTGFYAEVFRDSLGTNAYQEAWLALRINVTGSATTTVGQVSLLNRFETDTAGSILTLLSRWAPSSLMTFYAASAGTYTFQVQAVSNSSTPKPVGCNNTRLIAYEL